MIFEATLARMYRVSVQLERFMESVSVNKFRETLKDCVEKVISQHMQLKVTRPKEGRIHTLGRGAR